LVILTFVRDVSIHPAALNFQITKLPNYKIEKSQGVP
jgi:hypothetical protein